jgi:hypothetical protein
MTMLNLQETGDEMDLYQTYQTHGILLVVALTATEVPLLLVRRTMPAIGDQQADLYQREVYQETLSRGVSVQVSAVEKPPQELRIQRKLGPKGPSLDPAALQKMGLVINMVEVSSAQMHLQKSLIGGKRAGPCRVTVLVRISALSDRRWCSNISY